MLKSSPLLEIYKKKDIEVLILDDDFDEIVFSGVDKYGEIELKAVNKAATSEDLKDEADADKSETLQPLLEKMKATLGDRVKDVRASVRLADSPSVIVSDEDEPSLQMLQMMRAMGQKDMPAPKPTLEINPDHEIVKKLLARPDDALATDAAWLLLDQALLMEGVQLQDPAAFVQGAESGVERFDLTSICCIKRISLAHGGRTAWAKLMCGGLVLLANIEALKCPARLSIRF